MRRRAQEATPEEYDLWRRVVQWVLGPPARAPRFERARLMAAHARRVAFGPAPDSIDGDEADNDALLKTVPGSLRRHVVPVWHLHESFGRLKALLDLYPTVAFGSSGPFARPKSPAWWGRMEDAWRHVPPLARIHGLRMADPEIGARVPLASCDSSTAGRHANKGIKFPQPFRGCRPETRVRAYMEYFETACVPPKNFAGASERHNAVQEEVPWA